MAKFNKGTARPAVSSPVKTERSPTGITHEGAPGYARSDVRSELYLLSVTNMVSEGTFYETGADRDTRFQALVREVAVSDVDWLAGFLPWLRNDANMRSASLVAACEAVKARLDADEYGRNRQLIASVLQRPDEPGEALAYWFSRFGRREPISLKRGIADALMRLYTEKSLIKHDTDRAAFRFGDVIERVHPTAVHPEVKGTPLGDLFEHAIDRRHGRDNPIPDSLSTLRNAAELFALPVEERRAVLARDDAADVLRAAGITWEALSGWLQGPMDARAWEVMIPSMGYMALLRQLRNFDEAGVSDEVAEQVAKRLADPEQVARSRQFPMRFLSAYRAAPSLRWGHALDKALTASVGNIPALRGRTLVLVDTSSSMHAGFSKDGTLMRWDAAALFGVALAQRCERADVVSFSSNQRYWGDDPGARTAVFPLRAGESLLRSLDRWKNDGFFLGGGTDTAGAVRKHRAGHDRIVILTDEQAEQGDVDQAVPRTTPLVTFNLAGYKYGHAPSGDGLRVTVGGLTDVGFRLIPLLESGRNGTWPWLSDREA